MKPWKRKGVPLLAFILVLVSVAAAPGAILQTGSQLINLVSPGTSGPFSFKDMLMKDINGTAVPFSVPEGQVLMITRVGWNFTADNSSLNETVQLNVGNYWRVGAKMTNGFASASDSVNPGIAVTNFITANIYVSDLNDIQTPIPGTLSLRIVGYLAPNR